MSHPASSESSDEPVISFYWPEKGLRSHPDILPARFFRTEGFLPGQIHLIGSRAGKKLEAKCDVRVSGTIAELNYEPYPDFNRTNGALLGVTRLTFSDDTRTEVLSAEWKPQGQVFFDSPVTSASRDGLLEARSAPSRTFYRVMLGKKSAYAMECFAGGFIGAHFGIEEDLTGKLGEDWPDFNQRYIPVYLAKHPDKSKISAGLACGFLWTVSKGIKIGDVVLCPDGTGLYRVGVVAGDYYYAPGENLPHRRSVRWTDTYLSPDEMSDSLKHSARSIGTVSNLSRAGHHRELEKLLGAVSTPAVATDSPDEDPTKFALEKHLQEFLVHNWKNTELGKRYDIYADEDSSGEQVKADDGYIDILAISKDRKELLVVELKRGRASDVVVGQVQRYMGYVLDELAEKDQLVRGVIIALEDDRRIRRALRVTQNIEFLRYEVSFRLIKASP
ncbi:MAG: endonuclease NucS [Opitutus sp.]|nr:endonuclease NucS [Opitutus sp.]